MTHEQIAYIMALSLTLGAAQPHRLTVFVMAGNLAAMLVIAGLGDLGLVDHTGAIIFMMLADLACATVLAFHAPIVALLFAAMVPVYAIGLFAELPRNTTIDIVGLMAVGQLVAILGGSGGGGGLRDNLRGTWLRRRDSVGGVCDVVSSGAKE